MIFIPLKDTFCYLQDMGETLVIDTVQASMRLHYRPQGLASEKKAALARHREAVAQDHEQARQRYLEVASRSCKEITNGFIYASSTLTVINPARRCCAITRQGLRCKHRGFYRIEDLKSYAFCYAHFYMYEQKDFRFQCNWCTKVWTFSTVELYHKMGAAYAANQGHCKKCRKKLAARKRGLEYGLF